MAEPELLSAAEQLLNTLAAGRTAILQLASMHLPFSGLTAVAQAIGSGHGGGAAGIAPANLRTLGPRRLPPVDGEAVPTPKPMPPAEYTADDATPVNASAVSRTAPPAPSPVVAPVAPVARPTERRRPPPGLIPPAARPVAPSPVVVAQAEPPAPVAKAAPIYEPELALDEPEEAAATVVLPPRPAPAALTAPSAPLHAFAPAAPRAVAPVIAARPEEDPDEQEDEAESGPAYIAIRPAASKPAARPAGEEALAASGEDDAGSAMGTAEAAPGGGMRIASPQKFRRNADSGSGPRLTDDEESPATPSAPGVANILPAGEDSRIAELLSTANAAAAAGDLAKATQAFSDVLDLRHDRSDAFIGRGRCHLELGDYSSAMSDFQHAEDLHPQRPDAHVAMGDLYFARKEYRRAIELYDRAVELDGSHAMARCRRGISYYYRKNYRQAFQDLQRAYSLDPEIPNIRKYVQMAVKKMERGE